MKRMVLSLSICLVLMNVGLAQDVEKMVPEETIAQDSPDEVVNLQMTVYKIHGDISGKSSLTEYIFPDEKTRLNLKEAGLSSFFITADMTIAGMKFKATKDGWTWDGEAEPKSDKVKIMAKPSLLTTIPGNVEMQVGKQVEYMKPKPNVVDGYEVAKTKDPVGIDYKASIGYSDSNDILKIDYTFSIGVVTGRKPLPLTELNVGEPIIDHTEIQTSIRLKWNSYYGTLVQTKNGIILVKTKIEKFVKE